MGFSIDISAIMLHNKQPRNKYFSPSQSVGGLGSDKSQQGLDLGCVLSPDLSHMSHIGVIVKGQKLFGMLSSW